MPRWARRVIVISGALAITLVVFGLCSYVVSLLPQPQPTLVPAEIYPANPAPKP
jgi:hypothetical protein